MKAVFILVSVAFACAQVASASRSCQVRHGNQLESAYKSKKMRKVGKVDFPCSYPFVDEQCGDYHVQIHPTGMYVNPSFIVDSLQITVSNDEMSWTGFTDLRTAGRFLFHNETERVERNLQPVVSTMGAGPLTFRANRKQRVLRMTVGDVEIMYKVYDHYKRKRKNRSSFLSYICVRDDAPVTAFPKQFCGADAQKKEMQLDEVTQMFFNMEQAYVEPEELGMRMRREARMTLKERNTRKKQRLVEKSNKLQQTRKELKREKQKSRTSRTDETTGVTKKVNKLGRAKALARHKLFYHEIFTNKDIVQTNAKCSYVRDRMEDLCQTKAKQVEAIHKCYLILARSERRRCVDTFACDIMDAYSDCVEFICAEQGSTLKQDKCKAVGQVIENCGHFPGLTEDVQKCYEFNPRFPYDPLNAEKKKKKNRKGKSKDNVKFRQTAFVDGEKFSMACKENSEKRIAKGEKAWVVVTRRVFKTRSGEEKAETIGSEDVESCNSVNYQKHAEEIKKKLENER